MNNCNRPLRGAPCVVVRGCACFILAEKGVEKHSAVKKSKLWQAAQIQSATNL
jgi:hypothetical protein